jgi:hypothetical protein
VVNLLGSVAFQLAAFASFVGAGATPAARLFASNALTALGALCFGVGAYLLVPELFDTERTAPAPSPTLAPSAKSH